MWDDPRNPAKITTLSRNPYTKQFLLRVGEIWYPKVLKCLICLAYLHLFSLNFYLFHLSLMPEYLRVDLEFRDIEPTLPY